MPRKKPRKNETVPLSRFHNPPIVPKVGDIWWAACSVRQVILEVIVQLKLGPPSAAMTSDITSFTYNGMEKKNRPCIILHVYPASQTVSVVPLATFAGRAIASLDRYVRELCVSVGETNAWPDTSSHVVRPTPSWPLSHIRPCYAVSHAMTIKYSDLVGRYVWPVDSRRGAADAQAVVAAIQARAAASTFTSWFRRPARAPSPPLSIPAFILDATGIAKFEVEMGARKDRLKSKPAAEIVEMNATYDASRGVPL